jgi:hypothetical protein
MGSRFLTFSRTPLQMSGWIMSLAMRPDVPAYMKLSRNRLVFTSQNAWVSGSNSGRSFFWYTDVNTL